MPHMWKNSYVRRKWDRFFKHRKALKAATLLKAHGLNDDAIGCYLRFCKLVEMKNHD